MNSARGENRGVGLVVAGIGNEYRHDDGVGPAVAALVARDEPSVRDVGPAVEPLDLLGRWDDADLAVVIDAIRSGEPAGTVRVVELDARPGGSAGRRVTSSHGVDLPGAVRIARAVGRDPRRLVVVGVVGADFSQGPGLSPRVEAALPAVTRTVLDLIRAELACA